MRHVLHNDESSKREKKYVELQGERNDRRIFSPDSVIVYYFLRRKREKEIANCWYVMSFEELCFARYL